MSDWIEPALNIVFGALALMLLVKYRDKGILRRICESKYRFRTWLKSTAKYARYRQSPLEGQAARADAKIKAQAAIP
jgi:hypothetical protein